LSDHSLAVSRAMMNRIEQIKKDLPKVTVITKSQKHPPREKIDIVAYKTVLWREYVESPESLALPAVVEEHLSSAARYGRIGVILCDECDESDIALLIQSYRQRVVDDGGGGVCLFWLCV
jgi:hypothetical protein